MFWVLFLRFYVLRFLTLVKFVHFFNNKISRKLISRRNYSHFPDERLSYIYIYIDKQLKIQLVLWKAYRSIDFLQVRSDCS